MRTGMKAILGVGVSILALGWTPEGRTTNQSDWSLVCRKNGGVFVIKTGIQGETPPQLRAARRPDPADITCLWSRGEPPENATVRQMPDSAYLKNSTKTENAWVVLNTVADRSRIWETMRQTYKPRAETMGSRIPAIVERKNNGRVLYTLRVGPYSADRGRRIDAKLRNEGLATYSVNWPARPDSVTPERAKNTRDTGRTGSARTGENSVAQAFGVGLPQANATSSGDGEADKDKKSKSDVSGPIVVEPFDDAMDIQRTQDGWRIERVNEAGTVHLETERPLKVAFPDGHLKLGSRIQADLPKGTKVTTELGEATHIRIQGKVRATTSKIAHLKVGPVDVKLDPENDLEIRRNGNVFTKTEYPVSGRVTIKDSSNLSVTLPMDISANQEP